jgi:hypothetical protein
MSQLSLDIKGAKLVLKLFLISSILSYLYSLFTHQYGGDFLYEDVTISFIMLTLALIINLIPYYVLWVCYLNFKNSSEGFFKIKVSVDLIQIITYLFFAYTILVTILFGVGKMEADIYDAPSGVKFLIQIMNRISFLYVALFSILISKGVFYDVLAVLMILIVGYLISGLGSLLYVFCVFIVKYYSYLLIFYKRFKFIIVVILILFPVIINNLYEFRDTLRNSESKEISSIDLVFGKLAGRLSSFPNTAVIIQEPISLILVTISLEDYYYQKQAWRALVGGDYREQKPEYLMKGIFRNGDNGDVNSSFMTSTSGNLIISFIKSPLIFLLNIINVFLFIYIIFKILCWLKFEKSAEYAFIMTIYPVTSGVASEYVLIITTVLFLFLINLICGNFVIKH